jgi:hypothetical protein
MAEINLQEINEFTRNLYDRINVRNIDAAHAARIRNWFVGNMSNVGRYSIRDFERFGMLSTNQSNDSRIHKRQDGWQSVTEEVPDLEHITYGTGILYIHGEIELPPEIAERHGNANPLLGSQFSEDDALGEQHFLQPVQQCITGFLENEDGAGPVEGYQWEFTLATPPSTSSSSGNHTWQNIIESVANPNWPSSEGRVGTVEYSSTTPATFNDSEIYVVDNERANFPWLIVNSGQPASVDSLLVSLNGANGMYDEQLPSIATSTGTFPPVVAGGSVSISPQGRVSILDYISPLSY